MDIVAWAHVLTAVGTLILAGVAVYSVTRRLESNESQDHPTH
jgi:hypothetical protein